MKECKDKENKETEKESDSDRRWRSFKQWFKKMDEEVDKKKLISKGSKEDKKRPNSDYLVVDPKTGEKFLPVKEFGKLNPRLLGAAWAALHKGFRGNKYKGPGKSSALMKLKNLYRRLGKDTPEE